MPQHTLQPSGCRGGGCGAVVASRGAKVSEGGAAGVLEEGVGGRRPHSETCDCWWVVAGARRASHHLSAGAPRLAGLRPVFSGSRYGLLLALDGGQPDVEGRASHDFC